MSIITEKDVSRLLDELVRHQVELAEAKRQNAELEAALRKYTHCRHGCLECFCTVEAKAAIGGKK